MSSQVTPERLEIARLRRGIPKGTLAKLLAVAPRTLSKIFDNTAEQPDGFLERAVEALEVPAGFLTGPPIELPQNVSFRKLASLPVRDVNRGQAAGAYAVLIAKWMRDTFPMMPPVRVPDLGHIEDPETAAAAARMVMGIADGQIPHMVGTLERNGVHVFALWEDTKKLNAYTFWSDPLPFVMLNQFKSVESGRFDAAHELAHLCLDREGPATGKDVERRANAFAAAFLMPRADFLARRFPTTIRGLMAEKKHWRVSLSAIIRRCRDTGLIDEARYKTLVIQCSRAGYLKEEPEPLEKREASVTWPGIRRWLFAERRSLSSVAAEIGLGNDELERLTWSALPGVSKPAYPPSTQFPQLVGVR